MNVLVYVGQRLAVAAGLPSDGIDPAGRRATFILASVQMLVLHACGTAIFAHVLAPERRLADALDGESRILCRRVRHGCGNRFQRALGPQVRALESSKRRCRPGAATARPTSPSCALSHSSFCSDCGSTCGTLGGVARNSASCRIWRHAWPSSARTRRTSSSWISTTTSGQCIIKLSRRVSLDCTQAWELHHYLIAWIGTLFCAFDHPASVVCLAITTGIFVQGLAAYGPAEISDRRAGKSPVPDGPT